LAAYSVGHLWILARGTATGNCEARLSTIWYLSFFMRDLGLKRILITGSTTPRRVAFRRLVFVAGFVVTGAIGYSLGHRPQRPPGGQGTSVVSSARQFDPG
jgi:hypothetical protein